MQQSLMYTQRMTDRSKKIKAQMHTKRGRLWVKTIAEAARRAANPLARYSLTRKFVIGKSVCDIGCGVGYGSNYLAQTAKKITAMDISVDATDWASKYFSKDNLEFLTADAVGQWPMEDKFDVITSFETMEHVKNPEIFLENIYKHILPAGMLILSVPNGPRDEKRTDNPHHLHYFSDSDLKNLVQKYFPKAEYFSQAYKKGFKHYGTKLLRKMKLLKKQPYFVDNYFFKPGLCHTLKTWVVIAHK